MPEGWWTSGLCAKVRRSICCVGHISVHLSSPDIFCICPLLSPLSPLSLCSSHIVHSLLHFRIPLLTSPTPFFLSSASLVSSAFFSPPPLPYCWQCQLHSSSVIHHCSPLILFRGSSIFLQGLAVILTSHSSSVSPAQCC